MKIYMEKMRSEDLESRGRSNDTIKNRAYIIENFSRFYNKPPESLGEHEIINYLEYCIKQKTIYI